MNEYQKRNAERDAAATVKHSAIVIAIAAELGFLYGGKTHNQMYKIHDPQCRTIILNFGSTGENDRLVTTGDYPDTPAGHRASPNDPPRITSAKTRTAAALARDIKNRFYTDFCRAFDETKEKNEREQLQIDKAQAITNMIAEPLRLRLTHNNQRDTMTSINRGDPHFYSNIQGMGQIRLSTHDGESLYIERVTLTIPQALKFAAIFETEEQPEEKNHMSKHLPPTLPPHTPTPTIPTVTAEFYGKIYTLTELLVSGLNRAEYNTSLADEAIQRGDAKEAERFQTNAKEMMQAVSHAEKTNNPEWLEFAIDW